MSYFVALIAWSSVVRVNITFGQIRCVHRDPEKSEAPRAARTHHLERMCVGVIYAQVSAINAYQAQFEDGRVRGVVMFRFVSSPENPTSFKSTARISHAFHIQTNNIDEDGRKILDA